VKCTTCHCDFPRELLSELVVGNGKTLERSLKCPICALEIINKTHGLPAGTPFRGSIASDMHKQALEHLRRTRQTASQKTNKT